MKLLIPLTIIIPALLVYNFSQTDEMKDLKYGCKLAGGTRIQYDYELKEYVCILPENINPHL